MTVCNFRGSVDFGLSIDETKERPVTRAGTLDYMAPEVLNCPNKTYPEDNKNNRSIVYDSRVHMSLNNGPNTGEHTLGRYLGSRNTDIRDHDRISAL